MLFNRYKRSKIKKLYDSVKDSKVKDLYNKFERETDQEFLKEAIREMKRYEGNWSGMKSTEKRNIAPGGIKELKQNIVWAEQRLKQLQSGVKDSKITDLDDIESALRLIEIDMKVIRDYMEEIDSNPKATDLIKHYLNLIKKNCDRAIATTNRYEKLYKG